MCLWIHMTRAGKSAGFISVSVDEEVNCRTLFLTDYQRDSYEESIVQMCGDSLTKILADGRLLSLEGRTVCEILCMQTRSSVSFDVLFHFNITKPGRHPSAFTLLADLPWDVFLLCFQMFCDIWKGALLRGLSLLFPSLLTEGLHFCVHRSSLRAVANDCELSGFTQHKWISLQFWRSEV